MELKKPKGIKKIISLKTSGTKILVIKMKMPRLHTFSYLAWGWDAMKSTARLMLLILSASPSGISNPNSSSSAITTSTVSKLSNPRSFWKWAFGVTCKRETPNPQWFLIYKRHVQFTVEKITVSKKVEGFCGYIEKGTQSIVSTICHSSYFFPYEEKKHLKTLFPAYYFFPKMQITTHSSSISSSIYQPQKWSKRTFKNNNLKKSTYFSEWKIFTLKIQTFLSNVLAKSKFT